MFANGNEAQGFETHGCMAAMLHGTPHANDWRFVLSGPKHPYQLAIDKYMARRTELAANAKVEDDERLRAMAEFLAGHADFDQAEAVYSSQLRTFPRDAALLGGRGKVRLRLGRALDALSDFRAAIRAGSRDVAVLQGIAAALVKLGRLRQLHEGVREFSGLDAASAARKGWGGRCADPGTKWPVWFERLLAGAESAKGAIFGACR